MLVLLYFFAVFLVTFHIIYVNYLVSNALCNRSLSFEGSLHGSSTFTV